MPSKMHELFDQIHTIPQVPEVVRAIINQLADPHAAMLDIAKNVEKEQIIALKILRLVNSAHFGLSRKVASIDEATVMLGMSQLKTLVIASGMVSATPKLQNFDIKKFWNSSFRIAAYSKWFAEQARLNGDVAYTAGLLSNFGSILIRMCMPSEANEIEQHTRADHKSRSEIEMNRLGYTSIAVCAELCRRWKFAEELISAIEYSDNPLQAQPPIPLACCLYLARFVNDGLEMEKDQGQIANSFPMAVADKIGLDDNVIKTRLPEVMAIQCNLDSLTD